MMTVWKVCYFRGWECWAKRYVQEKMERGTG